MAKLILIRHGESQWNEKGLWTGLTDIGLSEKGKEEARQTGKLLQGVKIDQIYVSALSRAQETMKLVCDSAGIQAKAIISDKINERDYGIYTGKNKWEIKDILGEEKFLQLRRSWDYPIEGGESLKQVYDRAVPYYENEILPKLKAGENILIVAHGNSLRALAKYIEGIADEDIANLEIKTGEALVYEIGTEGQVISKEVKSGN